MLLVICKSQQTSNHLSPALGNEETPNFFGSGGGGGGGGISPMPESSIPNVIGSDILLDRYRELIANSLLKLYDSCKVHDFLQNIRRNLENDNGESEIIILYLIYFFAWQKLSNCRFTTYSLYVA